MMLAPGGDPLDDEEALTRLDEPQPPGLAHELLAGAGERDLLLEVRALLAQLVHLGPADVELLLRAEVRLRRLPVEEDEEGEPSDRGQARRSQARHDPSFAVPPPIPCALRECAGRNALLAAADGDDARHCGRDENLG